VVNDVQVDSDVLLICSSSILHCLVVNDFNVTSAAWLLVAIHLFLVLSVTMQGMGFRFCLNEKYPCPLIMALFTQTDTKKMTVQACEFEMFRRVTLRYLFLM
jgi:hypothetical protein